MNAQSTKEMVIGVGVLTWGRSERRTDRYGTVALMNEPPSSPNMASSPIHVDGLVGKHVKLVAEILDTRASGHIGDLFLGLFPRTPKCGDLILLGEGRLFIEDQGWATCVGVKPLDGRDHYWLSPRALYDCHEQTVKLMAEEVVAP